jgi:hypothetical protein
VTTEKKRRDHQREETGWLTGQREDAETRGEREEDR